MPHCIIEHSVEIDGETLISLVHRGALSSGLFQPEGSDIKVRSMPYLHYKTGSVDIQFVHVMLRILPGRTAEQKNTLSHLVLKQLETFLKTNCSVSVEVIDIDVESYAKVIV